MNSKIEAQDVLFNDFHKKASERYVIPTLQRPYSWDIRSIEKLWYDILENESGYYIGSVVAVTEGGALGRDQIIDGQQRLTTLSLVLIAIRDYIKIKKARGFGDIESDIDDMLLRYKKDEQQTRLAFSEEKSMQVYTALVNQKSINGFNSNIQKKFIKNYDFILDKIKEYSPKCKLGEIKEIFNKFQELQLIFIQCKDKTAAYSLFESLNATSMALTTNDLVKNSIFEALCEDNKKLKIVEDGWKNMYEEFDEDSSYLKLFIRHHWISTVGYISHSNLFKAFVEKYTGKEYEYAKSLFDLSSIYLSLRNGFVESLTKISGRRYDLAEIKESLSFLSFLGVDQVYPVLLFLYQNDNKNYKKDLNRLVAFQFLYKYVPGSPSVPEKKYFANFCEGKISKEDMFKGLYKLCDKQKQAFTDSLIQRIKYVKGKSGDVQFLLEKYIYLCGGTYIKKPTVEHIIPQDTTDPIYKTFQNSQENMKLIHSLGNLTILEEDENSDTNKFNQTFDIKKDLYKNHSSNANKIIMQYKFKKEPLQAILDRGSDMSSEIYDMFLYTLSSGNWKRKK
jgi:hypothetical protein